MDSIWLADTVRYKRDFKVPPLASHQDRTSSIEHYCQQRTDIYQKYSGWDGENRTPIMRVKAARNNRYTTSQ